MASRHSGNEKNILVIIDPQVDFHEGGSLAVAGALKDSERIAELIRSKRFDNILVTLDTHQHLDIGHPMWWTNDEKQEPSPFTIISSQDIENGKWKAANPAHQEWAKKYVKKLEANQRFKHTIWPYHCIVGTPGHEIIASINEALENWAKVNSNLVFYLWKGSNPMAEMYSAFRADVEVPGANDTKLNTKVLDRLHDDFDNIVICGEASSHCVRYSVTDMVEYFDTKKSKKPRLFLLSDCASPVTGYETSAKNFLEHIDKVCDYLEVKTAKDLKMIEDL